MTGIVKRRIAVIRLATPSSAGENNLEITGSDTRTINCAKIELEANSRMRARRDASEDRQIRPIIIPPAIADGCPAVLPANR